MAIQVSTESPDCIADSFKSTSGKPTFLIVNASATDGRMWCGDCRVAEPLLNAKFAGREDDVKIIFAGHRDEWRNVENPWRQSPFLVQALPTLIKVTDGKYEKLVEADVYDQKKLDSFVDE